MLEIFGHTIFSEKIMRDGVLAATCGCNGTGAGSGCAGAGKTCDFVGSWCTGAGAVSGCTVAELFTGCGAGNELSEEIFASGAMFGWTRARGSWASWNDSKWISASINLSSM